MSTEHPSSDPIETPSTQIDLASLDPELVSQLSQHFFGTKIHNVDDISRDWLQDFIRERIANGGELNGQRITLGTLGM